MIRIFSTLLALAVFISLTSAAATPTRERLVKPTEARLGIGLVAAMLGVGITASHAATVSNPTHDKLLQLSEAQRQKLFTGWIKGEKCGTVTKTFFQGKAPDGTALWSIACTRGPSYSISIYPDANGSTRILECGILKVIAKVDCFTKY